MSVNAHKIHFTKDECITLYAATDGTLARMFWNARYSTGHVLLVDNEINHLIDVCETNVLLQDSPHRETLINILKLRVA